MKKLFYIFISIMICSCAGNNTKEEKSIAKLRAEKDTTLVFQGIEIGKPLDTAKFNALFNSMPMKLYNSKKEEFVFDHISVDTVASWSDNKCVYDISVRNDDTSEFFIVNLISMYEEKYGCFSYYEAKKHFIESGDIMRMGDPNIEKGEGVYQRIDAINKYFETRHLLDGDDFMYSFVWEWKNRHIRISCCPAGALRGTTIVYFNDGFEQRVKESKEKEAADLKKQKEKNILIEEARSKQQI